MENEHVAAAEGGRAAGEGCNSGSVSTESSSSREDHRNSKHAGYEEGEEIDASSWGSTSAAAKDEDMASQVNGEEDSAIASEDEMSAPAAVRKNASTEVVSGTSPNSNSTVAAHSTDETVERKQQNRVKQARGGRQQQENVGEEQESGQAPGGRIQKKKDSNDLKSRKVPQHRSNSNSNSSSISNDNSQVEFGVHSSSPHEDSSPSASSNTSPSSFRPSTRRNDAFAKNDNSSSTPDRDVAEEAVPKELRQRNARDSPSLEQRRSTADQSTATTAMEQAEDLQQDPPGSGASPSPERQASGHREPSPSTVEGKKKESADEKQEEQASNFWAFFPWKGSSNEKEPSAPNNSSSASADASLSTDTKAPDPSPAVLVSASSRNGNPPGSAAGGQAMAMSGAAAAAAAAHGLAAFFLGGSDNEEALRCLSSDRASSVDEGAIVATAAPEKKGPDESTNQSNPLVRGPVVRFRGVGGRGVPGEGGDGEEEAETGEAAEGAKKKLENLRRPGNAVYNMGFVDLVESLLLNHDPGSSTFYGERGGTMMSTGSFPTSGQPSEKGESSDSESSLSEDTSRRRATLAARRRSAGRHRRGTRRFTGFLRGTRRGEADDADEEEFDEDEDEDDEDLLQDEVYAWIVEDVENYSDEIHAAMAKCLEQEAHHTELALKKSFVLLREQVEVPEDRQMIGLEARRAALDLTLLDDVNDASVKIIDTGVLLGLTLTNYEDFKARSMRYNSREDMLQLDPPRCISPRPVQSPRAGFGGVAGARRRWSEVAGNRTALQQMQVELSRLGSTSSEETSDDEVSGRTTRDPTPRTGAATTDTSAPTAADVSGGVHVAVAEEAASPGETGISSKKSVGKDGKKLGDTTPVPPIDVSKTRPAAVSSGGVSPG